MKTLTLWLSLYLTALLTRAADPVSPEEPKLHLRIHRAATLSNPGMAAVERGQMKHFVLNLEYKDAKACNLARDSFSDEKSAVHTVAWYDRFATVLIPAEEKQLKASLELLDNSVGLLWCEGVGAVTPPEPPPLPDAAPYGKGRSRGDFTRRDENRRPNPDGPGRNRGHRRFWLRLPPPRLYPHG